MGHIPGTFATVKRNSVELDFTSISYSRDANNVAAEWTVNLKFPINLDPEDTWSIEYGYGGQTWTLIDEALADQIGGENPADQAVRRISGRSQAVNLLELCVPKHLVYVNPTWLHSVEPRARLVDGIIQIVGKGYSKRFYHPRLPGKDIEDDEFICYLGPANHHDVGHHIANMLGYTLCVNTPNLDLVDTYTVPLGTSWWDALIKNFTLHEPSISLSGNTVLVMDVLSPAGAIPGVQKLVIDNPGIVTVVEDDAGQGLSNIIDHVIIEGRPSKNTTVVIPNDELDEQIIEISPEELEVNEIRSVVIPVEKMEKHKQMGDYLGAFGEDDEEYTPYNISNVAIVNKYHRESTNEKRHLVEQIVETYSDDKLKHRLERKHYFGPAKRPVKTVEKEWEWVYLPGTDSESFENVACRTTLQNRIVGGLNRTLTAEIVEQLVVYEASDDKKVSPIPLKNLRRASKSKTGGVDTDESTSQAVMEKTTNFRWTDFDRIDDELWAQTVFDHDIIARDIKITPQILETPHKDDIGRTDNEKPFRREFHPTGDNGTDIGGFACYHSPIRVQHDDLTTVEQMQAVADRIFARRAQRTVTASVKTPVLVPIDIMPLVVQLPAFTYDLNGADVEVPGGDYILLRDDKDIAYVGKRHQVELQTNQQLTVRSAF